MLRCANCKGPVDRNATVCPKCGRPKAGEEAAEIASGGCLIVVLAVIAFFAYAWISDDDKATPSETDATTQFHHKPEKTGPVEQQVALEQEAVVVDAVAEEATQNEVSSGAGSFTFDAILKDNDGKIVLQSGPRMMSKNVAILSAGTPVKVEMTAGSWMQVRTADGLTGYVRKRQLEVME